MLEILAPIIAVSLLICVLMLSIIIIARVGQKSFSRNVYLGVLVFWCIVLFTECYRLIMFADRGIDFSGYLYGTLIIMSTPCQLSLIFYAATVLFHRHINTKMMLLFLSPALVFMALNIGWDIHQKLPIVNYFHSLPELKANTRTVTFALRISLLIVQFLYMVFAVYSIRKIIPIYNRYLASTQSNENYNLHWLYRFMTALCAIALVYFITAFYMSPLNIIIYSLVASASFVLLISCIQEYESFPKFSEVKLQWSLKKGWHTLQRHTTSNTPLKARKSFQEILSWITENKLYANADFSLKELLNDFPNLSNTTLIETLELEGFTFQSLVRHIRIQMAIKIINETSADDLRCKDIYYQVGFSHYSSYARAFTSVMGIPPSQYKPRA